jgi:HPt (histidine-containing phosphotransfer) domain-containing protein
VWDEHALARAVGENPALQRRLLERFLCSAKEHVGQIGAAGLAQGIKTVVEQAHMLKSAARSVGAMQLADLCQAMEDAGKTGDVAACLGFAHAVEPAFSAAKQIIQVNFPD